MSELIEGDIVEVDEVPKGKPVDKDNEDKQPISMDGQILSDALMTQYIESYIASLKQQEANIAAAIGDKPNRGVLRHFVPYLRFNDHFDIIPKLLTPQELTEVSKKMYPDLAKVLEETDVYGSLPEEIDLLSSENHSPLLLAIGVNRHPGCNALRILNKFSQQYAGIHDLASVSLFMENGQQFLSYTQVLEEQLDMGGSLVYCYEGREDDERREGNLPSASFVFTPENIAAYIRETGAKDVVQMIEEYDSFQKIVAKTSDLRITLYGHLRTAHPEVVL